ncbi:MAG: MBL fold metallo-hydrolase [Rubrivivax sp.]
MSTPALEYPCGAPPAIGASVEVAPGVHWLRLPMPFRLDHINVWLLRDGDGWTLVDTGLRDPETLQHWLALFDGVLQGRPVRRVIGTHMHPDHIGLVGWITRYFGATLWMSRLEYLNCRALVADSGREAPDDALAFWRRAGWSRAAIESYRVRFGDFGRFIHPLPDSFRRLCDGDALAIDGRAWTVVIGTGHSSAHVCLHCPALGLFISGDQILPKISSNVSVHPTEPDADPMSDWLDTLARLRRAVPESVLVLPAHNECFRGLHARIDGLQSSQLRALDRLREALREPRRVVDLFEVLFRRPIPQTSSQLGLATGETVACLNHLMQRGEAGRERAADGVDWYRHLT